MSDLEIANQCEMIPIAELAKEKLAIGDEHLLQYGRYKAKLSAEYLESLNGSSDGKLILVSAMSPTPAGEGKTTTSIGLGDALNRIGKKTMICLREPSLGPCFGMKGGAAGGGYAQVVPMEDINLHFTGDFHAIGLANNLLSAMIDNHLHQGNKLGIDLRRVTWRRAIDMNDRALRDVLVSLGGPLNGYPREAGFDITAASEVMAILCLSSSLQELRERLGNIIIGTTKKREPVHAGDLSANGAMTVLLRDALQPNLVQTLEHNPVFIHGGPFANIAHGCNSVIATRAAMKLADYVVTEAGFGADLGAEKFLDIKCRKTGLEPSLVVIVATIRALKYHGGVDVPELTTENLEALTKGIANLVRHVENIRHHFGLPCIVALNRFTEDTDREIQILQDKMAHYQTDVIEATHWADGSAGAEALATRVAEIIDTIPTDFRYLYEDGDRLWDKIESVATRLYGASEVTANASIRKRIRTLQDAGYGHYPICIAKTQYSFSTDPKLRGAPSNHVLNIREVRLAAGAEFIVMVCGDILTMPGLPRNPAAEGIDIDDDGNVVGLF